MVNPDVKGIRTVIKRFAIAALVALVFGLIVGAASSGTDGFWHGFALGAGCVGLVGFVTVVSTTFRF